MRTHSRKSMFRQLLSLFLVLSLLGVTPGTGDALRLWAENETESQTTAADEATSADPFAVQTEPAQESEKAVESGAEEDPLPEPVKKEMGRIEKIAWNVGKALLPTLAVMGFCAAAALPLTWVVVGSVLVGATAAAAVTCLYENRMNEFRDEDSKMNRDSILRAMSMSAAVEGAMAPFTMMTGGLVQAVGPLTVRSVLMTSAKVGLNQFAGRTVANVAQGTVKNLWYDHYFNYDEKEKELTSRLQALRAQSERTPAEEQEIVDIMTQLDNLEKERYTLKDFRKDEQSALVSAAISGIMGGAASKMAGHSDWSKIASAKIFGTPDKAGMVAQAVVSNPFAFATGATNAGIQKREILLEIDRCREKQMAYEPGTPAWQYYEQKIEGLQASHDGMNVWQAGADAMVQNMAVQSAMVSVAAAKARLYELPHQRRQIVQERFAEQNAHWQKANRIKARLEVVKQRKPYRDEFATQEQYLKAVASHKKVVAAYQQAYNKARVVAVTEQNRPHNQAKIRDINQQVATELDYNRRLALAKSLGNEEYRQFKMEEIQKRQEEPIDPVELRKMAEAEILKDHANAAQANSEKLAEMERKMALNQDRKNLTTKIIKEENGTRSVAFFDQDGNEVFRRTMGTLQSPWYAKLIRRDPSKMTEAEIDAAQRYIHASGAMVKPSSYRATFVEMKMADLRAAGMTETQIQSQLPAISRQADQAMLNAFGGSWSHVVKSEALAAGLERGKYHDGEPPTLKQMFDLVTSTVEAKVIADFKQQVSLQGLADLPAPPIPLPGLGTPDPDDDDRLNSKIDDGIIRLFPDRD